MKGLVSVWRDSLRDDGELTPTTKLVGFVLSTYANGRGHAHPGRQTLARGSSIAVRSAERAITRLEGAGWIAVSRSRGGRSRTNGYALLLPETASPVRRLEWETATLRTRNGDTDDANGVTRVARKQLKAAESHGADAAAPERASSAPRKHAVPEDVCFGCSETKPLPLLVEDPPRGPYCSDECRRHEKAARWAS